MIQGCLRAIHLSGVSVCDTIKQGQWSNKSTFQKFYKKEIIDHSETFPASILSNVPPRRVVTAMISSFEQNRWDSLVDCPTTFTE